MTGEPIADYVAQLRKQIPRWVRGRSRWLAEIEQHLTDQVDADVAAGADRREAQRRAVARMGDAATLAGEFRRLQHGVYRARFVVGLLVVVAIAAVIAMMRGQHGLPRSSLPAETGTLTGPTNGRPIKIVPIVSVGTGAAVKINLDLTGTTERISTRRFILAKQIFRASFVAATSGQTGEPLAYAGEHYVAHLKPGRYLACVQASQRNHWCASLPVVVTIHAGQTTHAALLQIAQIVFGAI